MVMNRNNAASGAMKVLGCLLKAGDNWMTPYEISRSTGVSLMSVGSRIRDLRNDGFVINKVRDKGEASWRYGIPASVRQAPY